MINTTGLTHPALDKITRITPIPRGRYLCSSLAWAHPDKPVMCVARPPPQRRQSCVSPPGLGSRLLPGAEVGGHGGWRKGGAVDGDVGEAAGEEITAALQHPGP